MKKDDAATPTDSVPVRSAGRIRTTFAYYAAFVALALAMVSLGPTLPDVAAHTQTRLHEVSLLFAAHSLGYLLGSSQGGRLYDRLPGHPVLGIALLTMAVMLALVPLTPVLWLLAAVLLLLGIGEGILDVGGNTLLVWLHGSQVGPFMNGLHFAWGVGAFLLPVIVAQVGLARGGLAWTYRLLALLMLPPAIWLLRLPSPQGQAPARTNAPGQVNVPAVALSAVLLFLYVGAEGAFGGWIFTYSVEAGLVNERMAAYLTSAYWGAYTVARLLAIPISLRLAPRTMLLWDTVGCLLSAAVMLLWPGSPVAIWLGALGLGASMGSIFPTVISLGERHSHITGRVMGWFFLGGSAGAMSIPWLIGQLFEPIGPRATLWVIVVDLALMTAVFGALMWSLERTRAAEA